MPIKKWNVSQLWERCERAVGPHFALIGPPKFTHAGEPYWVRSLAKNSLNSQSYRTPNNPKPNTRRTLIIHIYIIVYMYIYTRTHRTTKLPAYNINCQETGRLSSAQSWSWLWIKSRRPNCNCASILPRANYPSGPEHECDTKLPSFWWVRVQGLGCFPGSQVILPYNCRMRPINWIISDLVVC